MLGELRGALHRHHPEHHQPLHADGAEGRSLMKMKSDSQEENRAEDMNKVFCVAVGGRGHGGRVARRSRLCDISVLVSAILSGPRRI